MKKLTPAQQRIFDAVKNGAELHIEWWFGKRTTIGASLKANHTSERVNARTAQAVASLLHQTKVAYSSIGTTNISFYTYVFQKEEK